jgi:hypothetical protein
VAKNSTPLERHEQAAFVDWLERQGLLFSATAQSTYTTSWNQKRLNHATGLRKGVPDMLVLIPKDKSKDGGGYCLFIELKRVKGGSVSKEQKHWLDSINSLGTPYTQAYIAKGASEAIRIVSHYLKTVENSVF